MTTRIKQLLDIPHTQRKIYSRNFLSSVHLQIRIDNFPIKNIFEKIDLLNVELDKEGYRKCESINNSSFTFGPKESEPAKLIINKAEQIGFKFTNVAQKIEISIEEDSIILSNYNYKGMDIFLQQTIKAIELLLKALYLDNNLVIRTVGLRKICSLIISPVDSLEKILDIFNPSLFSVARSDSANLRYFKFSDEKNVFQNEDGDVCVLRSMLQKKIKNDSGVELEAGLDFDLASTEKISFDQLQNQILCLNEYHFDIFRWAVTKNMILLMENQNEIR